MGLIDRLRRITSARIEAFLDSAEDPELLYPQLVLEMEEQVRAATNAEAKAMGAVKNSQSRIDEVNGRVERMTRGAQLAVQSGDEDLAREALGAQLSAESDLKRAQEALGSAQAALDEAQEARKQVQESLTELRIKKDEILTRARLAKTQKKVQQSVQGPAKSSGSILDAVSRMENKLREEEAEIQVRREMSGGSAKPSLDKKLRALEANAEIEARLAALRKQSRPPEST
jgi:phage shock protein A